MFKYLAVFMGAIVMFAPSVTNGGNMSCVAMLEQCKVYCATIKNWRGDRRDDNYGEITCNLKDACYDSCGSSWTYCASNIGNRVVMGAGGVDLFMNDGVLPIESHHWDDPSELAPQDPL